MFPHLSPSFRVNVSLISTLPYGARPSVIVPSPTWSHCHSSIGWVIPSHVSWYSSLWAGTVAALSVRESNLTQFLNSTLHRTLLSWRDRTSRETDTAGEVSEKCCSSLHIHHHVLPAGPQQDVQLIGMQRCLIPGHWTNFGCVSNRVGWGAAGRPAAEAADMLFSEIHNISNPVFSKLQLDVAMMRRNAGGRACNRLNEICPMWQRVHCVHFHTDSLAVLEQVEVIQYSGNAGSLLRPDGEVEGKWSTGDWGRSVSKKKIEFVVQKTDNFHFWWYKFTL